VPELVNAAQRAEQCAELHDLDVLAGERLIPPNGLDEDPIADERDSCTDPPGREGS